jgi:hypothetical protein
MNTSRLRCGAMAVAFLSICATTPAVFALANGASNHGGKTTIPATTELKVKLDETVNAKTPGEAGGFTVTFIDPVRINGTIVIPAGATGAGLLSGGAQHCPQIELNSVFVNGRSYRISTSPIVLNTKIALPAGKKFTFDLIFSLNIAN